MCGADLWDTRDEPLGDAVREQEASESSESEQLELKEADEAKKVVLKGLFLATTGVLLTISGLFSPSMLRAFSLFPYAQE